MESLELLSGCQNENQELFSNGTPKNDSLSYLADILTYCHILPDHVKTAEHAPTVEAAMEPVR
jgi:hypothetical protein